MAPCPMFPLGTVLFPHALLPLHVFEPRYRVMTRHCLDGDREFGVVLIERGSEVGGGDARFDIGTVARIVQAAEAPDGRWALTAVGVQRARVLEWLPDDPYPRADIEAIDEPAPAADDGARRARVVATLDEVLDLWRQVDPRVNTARPEIASDPVRASFELAACAPVGPLDAHALLCAVDASARFELLESLLRERADELRALLR
jgi:Lon protease-like protein